MNLPDTDSSNDNLATPLQQLEPHSHLCLIYETRAEQLAAVIPFLRAGLRRGEQCIYIADENDGQAVLQALQAAGVDVEAYQRANALVMMDKRGAYLRSGRFNPDQMIELLQEQVQAAKNAGFKALRATGEMSWALGPEPGVERLLEYEAKLNRFFPQHDCIGLCQYHRGRFSPEILKGVLETHRLVIVGGRVCQNCFYIPPEEYFAETSTARQVARMLAHLRDRVQRETHHQRLETQMERLLTAHAAELKQANDQLRQSYQAALNLMEDAIASQEKLRATVNQLRDSEERYRRVFENTLVGIYRTTPDGRVLLANPAFVRMLGYRSFEELAQVNVDAADFHPEYPRRKFKELMERDGTVANFESTWRQPDGRIIYVVESAVATRDEQGNILYYDGVIVDITERKRVEADLQRLATAIGQAAEAVVVTDSNGTIQYVNPAFEQMTGYSAAEALGQNPRILKSGKQDAEFYQNLWATILHGETWKGRFVNRRKNGTLYQEEAVISPVRDADGRITNFVAVKHDITDRERATDALREMNERLDHALSSLKRAQSKLLEQQRLQIIGQMASGIAHDFNNALAPILGFSELLLERPDMRRNDEKLLDILKLIFASAKDAANVVRQLRELYRKKPERTGLTLVSLPHVIKQAVRLTESRWREEAAAAGVRIGIELDLQPVPETAGNESALREALMNLILNAVDAMPRGGTISLKTRSDQHDIWVEVADTGEGMSEEVCAHCFDPFYTTKGERGSGLGLAMVHAIVHNHGGDITVASEPGKGSRFTIRLPIQPLPDKTTDLAKTGDTGPALRILLVDDEQVVRRVYAEYLSVDGHQVIEAESGPAGLAMFARERFDVVVTDMAMIGMNGEQFAARIQELRPGTPIVLLTGFGDLMKARGEKPPGVTAVLGKPATLADLRAAIREALQSAASLR